MCCIGLNVAIVLYCSENLTESTSIMLDCWTWALFVLYSYTMSKCQMYVVHDVISYHWVHLSTYPLISTHAKPRGLIVISFCHTNICMYIKRE